MVDDAILESHDDVEVAQPDVRVDEDDRVTELCERGSEVGGGRRFTDSTFS